MADNGSTSGDGSAWGEDAYLYLNEALADAAEWVDEPGNTAEVWVAATDSDNPYTPTQGSDRSIAFELHDDVAILGGFDGDDEPGFVNRDDNSYNVVRAFNTNDSPRLDGFTIVGGFAEGVGTLEDYGGAVIVYLVSPTISRCTFTDNWASTGGGAAHVEGPGPFDSGEAVVNFFDCAFMSNARHDTSPPSAGGGLCNRHGEVTAVNCLFYDNRALKGAGVFNSAPSIGAPTSEITLVNCTIVENDGSNEAGGVQSHATTTVTNCILWGNTSNACNGGVCPEESQIDISSLGSGTVSYCCIENLDSFTGNNNIDDDPDFGGASGGNFRLRDGSAAIDAASTSTMSAYKDLWDFDHDSDYGPTGEAMPDLDLGDRVLNGGTGSIVDMGAYEHVAGCDGDTNGDQVVDVQDLLAILENWDCTTCPDEDLDGSGTVGVGDLLEVLGNWGACGAADSASPPESVLDCLDKYSGEPENQAACIEAMILTGSP